MGINAKKVIIIAEAGVNHNGSLELAKKLIDGAVEAGADIIKFQKRNIDKVYSKEELNKLRESPWGKTNREQKLGLEFGELEYDLIDIYCKQKGIEWMASCWDLDSVKFMQKYDLKYNKIASARLGHIELLTEIAKQGKYTFISTGMATLEEIEKAINIFKEYNCPFELMHCNSQYPLPHTQANLRCIRMLANRFNCLVGYSCHTSDIIIPCAAVCLGATSIEKHITLDRASYGSDQSASVEIHGFIKMVDYIRSIEASLGDGIKRISPEEEKIRAKLWRKTDV